MALVHRDDLLNDWRDVCSTVVYAFQPVVGTHNGTTYGFECLLRGWQTLGFDSIAHLFDRAEEDGVMLEVNAFLLRKAIETNQTQTRLFFNVDNRVFHNPDAGERLGNTIRDTGIDPQRVTLEITEQTQLPAEAHESHQLPYLRSLGVQIALDDFGAGYSGLYSLYQASADIIKIDQFFIREIDHDSAKRIFVTNLVNMAHAMGERVVAEGVEKEREFYIARSIGCDYIQGYLVAPPEVDIAQLQPRYQVVGRLITADRRNSATSEQVLFRSISKTDPIVQHTPILDVLKRFRNEPDTTFIPVVNEHGEPQGIIREQELKSYVYSPYGISLLMNQSKRPDFDIYVRRVPVVSIYSRIDRILEFYALDPDADALLVTDEGRYVGCLDSKSLLQILHERELATARDQNPLTRLPGNTIIDEYLSAVYKPNPDWNILVYVDFNYFKPFNDTYGFRVGDRVIQLFADLLRVEINDRDAFAGHIGGDDLFLAYEADESALEECVKSVRRLIDRFAQDVRGFYSPADIERGYICALDRDGNERRYEILNTSAAVLLVPPHAERLPTREVSHEITVLKHSAKRSSDGIAISSIVAPVLVETAS